MRTSDIRIFFAIFVASAVFVTGPTKGAGPIPGIDTIQRAFDPDAKPVQKKEEKAPEKKDEPKKDDKPPEKKDDKPPEKKDEKVEEKATASIKNIKVEAVADSPYSAHITWEFAGNNDSPIFIGRYTRPTTNVDFFLDSENLTSPALGPKETSFTDRGIPSGTHYYVVVTEKDMRYRDKMVLMADVNYTTKPFVVSRRPKDDTADKKDDKKDEPKVNEDDYHVFNLLAVNSDKSVKLNWTPARAKGLIYMVYRSPTPYTNALAVARAPKLAALESDTLFFEDRAPIEDKEAYYLVTALDLQTGREHKVFTENQTVLKHTFKRDKTQNEFVDFLPDVLTAVQTNKTTVKLYWAKPDKEVSDFRVYRSDRPIDSETTLARSDFVGRAGGRETSFADGDLRPGQYFYAVLPRDSSGKEVRAFVEGRTFTGFAVSVLENRIIRDQPEPAVGDKKDPKNDKPKEEKKDVVVEPPKKEEPPKLKYLKAEGRESAAKVSWELDKSDRPELKVAMYRSDKPMRNIGEVKANGTLVGEIDPSETEYYDTGLAAGKYYYAVLPELSGKLVEKMVEGKNFLRDAVSVKGPETIIKPDDTDKKDPGKKKDDIVKEEKPDHSVAELNRLLAGTYWRGRYADAIREMGGFLHGGAVPDDVRARALFFTGLSYFQLKDYDRSMQFFLHGLVQREYPERSKFWYSRAVEKIR